MTIVDSIMGSGKTEAMLETIRKDKKRRFFFVTPYLREILRVIDSTDGRLKQPPDIVLSKLTFLHELLRKGESVAVTHVLFLKATKETEQLIRDGGYTLIIDETLDVNQDYNERIKAFDDKTVKKSEIDWLIKEKLSSVDDRFNLTWNSSETKGFRYSEIVRMSEEGTLRCVDGSLIWEFPVSVIKAFEKAYVLTYNCIGTVFDSYLKLHGLEYDLLSARRTKSGAFELCPYADDLDIRKELSKRISVYEGPYNRIGEKHYDLSVSDLTGMCADEIKEVKKCMRNVNNGFGGGSSGLMFTTSMKNDFYHKLEPGGFKYTRRPSKAELALPEDEQRTFRCFVPCNMRATNDFSDRYKTMFVLNSFLNPVMKKYYYDLGVPVDENVYATNLLIQWLWRSRIRLGEQICAYVPSSRMRDLLYDWMGK